MELLVFASLRKPLTLPSYIIYLFIFGYSVFQTHFMHLQIENAQEIMHDKGAFKLQV